MMTYPFAKKNSYFVLCCLSTENVIYVDLESSINDNLSSRKRWLNLSINEFAQKSVQTISCKDSQVVIPRSTAHHLFHDTFSIKFKLGCKYENEHFTFSIPEHRSMIFFLSIEIHNFHLRVR